MKYLLMIYGNQEKWNSIPAEEWPEGIGRQEAWNRKYRDTGERLAAYGLADAAADAYRQAAGLTSSLPERRYLIARANRLTQDPAESAGGVERSG